VAKHCSNKKCLNKKNYKAKFLIISKLKKKINKDNFRKKHVEKHCTKAKFLTISKFKKNKFNKDNFRKKTCGKTL
jgi:hypothetical protein